VNHRVKPPKREPSELAKKLRKELLERETVLNVADVAYVIDRDESTVLRLIRSGDLPAVKRGREYEITESDLREYSERLTRKQREQVRIKQVTRDVQEEFERLRNTPAARYWAYVSCTNCGRRILYQSGLGGEDGDTAVWSTTCPYCGEWTYHDYHKVESIATRDEELERCGDLVRDLETGHLTPNPLNLNF